MYGKEYYYWARARDIVADAHEDDPYIVQELRRRLEIPRIPDPTSPLQNQLLQNQQLDYLQRAAVKNITFPTGLWEHVAGDRWKR